MSRRLFCPLSLPLFLVCFDEALSQFVGHVNKHPRSVKRDLYKHCCSETLFKSDFDSSIELRLANKNCLQLRITHSTSARERRAFTLKKIKPI